MDLPANTETNAMSNITPSRMERAKLFGTGFLQVIFVAMNTVFISNYALIGNLLTAFMISYIWTHNVKKIAFGDGKDRLAYASGAALGSICGTIIASNILG